ncbi:hypothetical protein AA313_de0210192 [Arthrobotrys entomopaga]|nr:hypothetical protein AA313_de0210192 [Arthrobotrys entomopaga]
MSSLGHAHNYTLGPHDVRWDEMFDPEKQYIAPREPYPILDRNIRGMRIYSYNNMAIKPGAIPREIEMTALAPPECCVRVFGHVYIFDLPNGQPRKIGLTMEIAQPFYQYLRTGLSLDEKRRVRDQMIGVVGRLHEKNFIHGDIKPSNFLRCSDGRIVLCDFEAARPEDEDYKAWMDGRGQRTNLYYSPECLRRHPGGIDIPPTKVDDRYALAISIWELFTEKPPLEEYFYGGDPLSNYIQRGGTVDVTEVEDLETRDWITQVLREGGANI